MGKGLIYQHYVLSNLYKKTIFLGRSSPKWSFFEISNVQPLTMKSEWRKKYVVILCFKLFKIFFSKAAEGINSFQA